MPDVDVIIIGAGAAGLACGAACARRGQSVLVLEAAERIGAGISARNSEVIHAGLYYATGGLKHRFCVAGRRRLYRYLAERGVAHRRTGKLIVATEAAEIAGLEALHARGLANGVEGLELIDGAHAQRLEPELRASAALLSSETGVFDAHGYMLALQGEIEDAGGSVVLATEVVAVERTGDGLRVIAGQGDAVTARVVVNSAGLHAPALAMKVEGFDPVHAPRLFLAKGSYFSCTGRAAFSRLIYPAPVDGGLGVHLTLDVAGRMRFGPDVEWLDAADPDGVDYAVDPARAEGFYAAVRRYWPGLRDGALAPDYSGVRPKLNGPGEAAADFRIDGPEVHGVGGLINLFGIESPGLTSSSALGDYVADMITGGREKAEAGLQAALTAG